MEAINNNRPPPAAPAITGYKEFSSALVLEAGNTAVNAGAGVVGDSVRKKIEI